jgi:hypothetical protein
MIYSAQRKLKPITTITFSEQLYINLKYLFKQNQQVMTQHNFLCVGAYWGKRQGCGYEKWINVLFMTSLKYEAHANIIRKLVDIKSSL